MTRTEWVNRLSKDSKVPKWMIETLWTEADIDMLLESETEEEYERELKTLEGDIDLFIEYLKRLKTNLK